MFAQSVRELWALEGPYFKIPLSVTKPPADRCRITIGGGIHLLPNQRLAAEAVLAPLGEKIGNRFYIYEAFLRTVATPVTVEAQDVLEWNPPRPRYPKPTLQFENPEMNEFCQDFFEHYSNKWLEDVSQVIYIFNALCKHMLHWLLNKQRSVNLTFCKLHALPVRENWKEVLMSLEPVGKRQQRTTPVITRIADRIFDERLLAQVQGKTTANWILEVEPLKTWEWSVGKLEEARAHRANPWQYWDSLKQAFGNKVSTLILLYHGYNRATFAPHPKFCSNGRGKRTDPETGKRIDQGYFRPDPGDVLRERYLYRYRLKILQAEIERLSKVPRVRSRPLEVRHTGPEDYAI